MGTTQQNLSSSSDDSVIVPARHDHFAAILNSHEIRQLIREGEHLKSKRDERALTQWESERLITLVDELSRLVREFAAVA